MAKVRLEDLYDEDDNDELIIEVHTQKTHKQKRGKDQDDVLEKSKRKSKACKIRQNRQSKNEAELNDNED